jgi:hypothetical protein
MIHRRDFLKKSFLAASALPIGWPSLAAEKTASASGKFILSAPLTHSDWMLKPGVPWGAQGVRQMLDACKDCGWSRIYWRVLDGGRSLYRSKLLRPMGRWDQDSFWNPQTEADKALLRRYNPNQTDAQRQALLSKFDVLDYARFDPFAEAVRYGRKIGLQVHAWVSINEDDHGWGLQSEFSKKHPEFRWRGRGGKVYHSQLSFAFDHVRRYKLAILKELLANYDLDGLLLDWIRTGDVRDNPQNDHDGVADYGYEGLLVEQFRKKFGHSPDSIPNTDEAWVRLRAEPQTVFMRDVRHLVRQRKPRLPIAVLAGHPWHYRGEGDKIAGNLRGLLLDLDTWAREDLMDAAVPAGYYRDGGNPELAWQALRKETGGRIDVWTYAWVPRNIGELSDTCVLAEKLGARQILFWEADYIADRANGAELKAAMRARAV